MATQKPPTQPPESEDRAPILTNMMLLQWIQNSEKTRLGEHKTIYERMEQLECMQVARYEQHQKALEELFKKNFAQLECLHKSTIDNVQSALFRSMNPPTLPAGAVRCVAAAEAAIEVPDAIATEAPGEIGILTAPAPAILDDMRAEPRPGEAIPPRRELSKRRKLSRGPSRNAMQEFLNVRGQREHMENEFLATGRLFEPKTLKKLSTCPDTGFARVMKSSYIATAVGTLIVLNAIVSFFVIGLEMDDAVENPGASTLGTDDKYETFMQMMESFTYLFTIEVLLRLAALKLSFFFGDDYGWNILDLLLISNDLLEKAAVTSGRMSSLRMLRVCRVARIFRILRLMSFFKGLRVFVCSLLASAESLAWGGCLVVLVIYICSIVFMQGLLGHIEGMDRADALVFVERSGMKEVFGDVPQAMYSLVQAVTGGRQWSEIAAPLEEASAFLPLVFCAYVVFILFGVSAIVIQVLIRRTDGLALADLEMMMQQETDCIEVFVVHLRDIFLKMGFNTRASLTIDDLVPCLKHRTMQMFLANRKIDLQEACFVFERLEVDESLEGGVTVDDFIYACLERRYEAKSADVRSLLQDTRVLMDYSIRTCEDLRASQALLLRIAETLTSQFAIVRHDLEELQVTSCKSLKKLELHSELQVARSEGIAGRGHWT